jgi:hypothetical protein
MTIDSSASIEKIASPSAARQSQPNSRLLNIFKNLRLLISDVRHRTFGSYKEGARHTVSP